MHRENTPDSGQESGTSTNGEERLMPSVRLDDSLVTAHDPLKTEMGLDPLRYLD